MPTPKTAPHSTCDIFCSVIDNYGDIGVCWRLARLLAHEHGLAVRLWVDDLASFAKLCPQADASLLSQQQRSVMVCRWDQNFPLVQPADIVIAAFACKLPETYVESMAKLEVGAAQITTMAAKRHSLAEPDRREQGGECGLVAVNHADVLCAGRLPVWINLEYLSAEDWVEGCHKLPSPHPRLPLTKYFFFPGFTRQTGGLLLEHDLLARRDAFLADAEAQQRYWQGLGIAQPRADTLKVSLFAYENAALRGLFDAWALGAKKVLCLVPEGRILSQVAAYFADVERTLPRHGEGAMLNSDRRSYAHGNLQVRVLPFVAQEEYDLLLWACDVNFVRGEDSCVRAQWAGKPFIWQIYPQHDAVHRDKLQAFLLLYSATLSSSVRQAVQTLWTAWNDEGNAGAAWGGYAAASAPWTAHGQGWARRLAGNDLALNLLDFCQETGRMRALEIEGQ